VSFTHISDTLRVWLDDHGFSSQEINDVSCWTKEESITLDEVRYLTTNPLTILTTRVPWSYVNLQATIGLMQMIKYLSVLTIALQFPAIDTSDHFNDYAQPGTKRRRTSEDEQHDSEVLEYQGEGYLSGVSGWISRHIMTPISHHWKVSNSHVAIPRSVTLPIRTTSTALAPFEEGHWFPFDADIPRIDDDGPIHLLTTHCYHNFATTEEGKVKMSNTLRSSWGILKRVSVGHEIAHFAKGISLAITSQSAIRPIFSGEYYEGFLLVGHGIKVIVDESVITAIPAGELMVELRRFVSHDQALKAIHKILTGMDVADDTDLSVYESMASLRSKVLESKDTLSTSDINDLLRFAGRLRFPVRKWSSNYQNIAAAANIIASRQALDSTCPIAADLIATEEILPVVLSCFGRQCPSLIIPDGRKIDLTRPMPQPTQRIIEGRGQRPARSVTSNDQELTIQARLVEFETAVSDWRQLLRDKSYRVAPLQTARANNYKVFRGADRGVLFDALRSMINNEGTVSGGPRDNDVRNIGREPATGSMMNRVGEGFEFVCIVLKEVITILIVDDSNWIHDDRGVLEYFFGSFHSRIFARPEFDVFSPFISLSDPVQLEIRVRNTESDLDEGMTGLSIE